MTLSYGCICSGISAATVAWREFGFRPLWFAEIEKNPSIVLAHRHPAVPNLGDMTKIAAAVRAGHIGAPDALVGGTPCQAFSVAGARQGLVDPRGQLTLSYVDLLNAIDEQRPGDECVAIWENVPGVLSDKTNAFGCFLGLLAGEECALLPPGKSWPNAGYVLGPQRAIAWRVLDAQYFGVAQRRRRVFLVTSARKGFDPYKLLFESDGMRRDHPPSRETRQDLAGALSASAGRRCGVDDPERGKLVAVDLFNGQITGDVTQTLLAGAHAPDPGGTPHVLQPVAYGGNNCSGPIDVATARNACGSATGRLEIETETFLVQTVCVTGEVTHCLKAEGFDASEDGTGRGQPIVAAFMENQRGELRISPATNALSTGGGKPGQGYAAAITGMAVRRLTPRECERLQGFPDDYTLVPLPLKGRQTRQRFMADGPRYKMLGNSMAVPCMRWLAIRLILTHPLILVKIAK